MKPRLVLTLLAVSAAGGGQQLRVVSEFQRLDPFGEIVAADRAERPREILSPALPRNAYSSFHIGVTLPQGGSYFLYVGQNPEDAVRLTLFKEVFEKRGNLWVPDRLVPVGIPFEGRMPEAGSQIDGQTTAVFWLDIWVAPDSLVRRLKVEPQLNVAGDWLVYPMEVRIVAPVVPPDPGIGPPWQPPPPEAPADESARPALASFLCRSGVPAYGRGATVRHRIARNASQDMRLARLLAKTRPQLALPESVLSVSPVRDPGAWCAPGGVRVPAAAEGAEWYLKVRDFLLRAR